MVDGRGMWFVGYATNENEPRWFVIVGQRERERVSVCVCCVTTPGPSTTKHHHDGRRRSYVVVLHVQHREQCPSGPGTAAYGTGIAVAETTTTGTLTRATESDQLQ